VHRSELLSARSRTAAVFSVRLSVTLVFCVITAKHTCTKLILADKSMYPGFFDVMLCVYQIRSLPLYRQTF